MLKITSISGNISVDPVLEKKFQTLNKKGKCEILKLTRTELEKNRMRKNTDNGTDVGILLDDGVKLHHGDVLESEDKFILVEQMPEKVLAIRLTSANSELPVLVGHIIGNRHRPISIDNDYVLFPIQADSELEVFKGLFSDILDNLEIEIQERVFVPHKDMSTHEH